ncbi:UNKNOWN [Stylonychia lemnae]|uniref:Uncharacterized protein n=1 Tax=Stylonychia lemnae TaxID=5949 RepID=A0A078A072_STYLE|nr:UNKNOWN [Stylonychia lemnae]|eukprot:CDW75282.1 UNKNOWN [Stylonychia lemnae]
MLANQIPKKSSFSNPKLVPQRSSQSLIPKDQTSGKKVKIQKQVSMNGGSMNKLSIKTRDSQDVQKVSFGVSDKTNSRNTQQQIQQNRALVAEKRRVLLQSRKFEHITGFNISKLKIDDIVSQVNHDGLTFEGMPRMIFEDERPGQKINWIKLVNNMISFGQQSQENFRKRANHKQEREQSPQQWDIQQQRQEADNLQSRISLLESHERFNQMPQYRHENLRTSKSFRKLQEHEQFRFERDQTQSMIDYQEDELEEDYDFESLNYRRKMRRKSCVCTLCSGSKLLQKKGTGLVSDDMVKKLREEEKKSLFSHQPQQQSKITKEQANKIRINIIQHQDDVISRQIQNEIQINNNTSNAHSNNSSDVQYLQIDQQQKDQPPQYIIKRHYSYDPKAFFNNQLNSQLSNLKAMHLRQQSIGETDEQHNSQKSNDGQSQMIRCRTSFPDQIKPNSIVKVPQPLFREKYFKVPDTNNILQPLKPNYNLLSEETKKKLRFPHLAKDLIENRLNIRNKKNNFWKIMTSKSVKELEIKYKYKPQSVNRDTHKMYKQKPITIPKGFIQTSRITTPKASVQSPKRMSQGISLPDFDMKNGEDIMQPFTHRTQKNQDLKNEDLQIQKLKSYKIGASYYFTPTNFALKNAAYHVKN